MQNNLKTHCKHGHEFTPNNTSIRPSGVRRCKACNRRDAMACYIVRPRPAKVVTPKEPKPRPTRPLAERFWEKVNKTATCWEWTGSRHGKGYGHFRVNDLIEKAHRVAVLLSGREIPKGMTVDHLCMNTCCVRPDHLEVVTGKVNTLRGGNLCAQNARKTHCPKGHEFTPETTKINKVGSRFCGPCRKEYNFNYSHKPKPQAL